MPDREEIKRAARSMLGAVLASTATGEYGMLARLLAPDESIDAMALSRRRGGGLVGSQRFVTVTSRRILLLEKGFFTRRERVEQLDWDRIRDVHVKPPGKLDFELTDGEVVRLSFVQPPEQLGRVADLVRRRVHADDRRPEFGELAELARRKLGRLLAFGSDSLLLALGGVLASDEEVLDMGYAGGGVDGLVTVTTSRLIVVPVKGVGAGEPVAEPFESLELIELVGDDGIRFAGSTGQHRLERIVPEDRAAVIVDRVRARVDRRTRRSAPAEAQ